MGCGGDSKEIKAAGIHENDVVELRIPGKAKLLSLIRNGKKFYPPNNTLY
jgi:hypothetical protein